MQGIDRMVCYSDYMDSTQLHCAPHIEGISSNCSRVLLSSEMAAEIAEALAWASDHTHTSFGRGPRLEEIAKALKGET